MIFSFLKLLFVTLISFGRPVISQNLKCLFLNNRPCTLIDLNPNELSNYPCIVSPDRCGRSCNALYLSSKICVPNKTKDLNSKVFNIIAWINESKRLKKT